MIEKIIFRTTTLFLIFFPLFLLYYGETSNLLIFKIISFLMFSVYIFTGITSFNSNMIKIMLEKESYIENIMYYAFNHEFKFGLFIFSGLFFLVYFFHIMDMIYLDFLLY